MRFLQLVALALLSVVMAHSRVAGEIAPQPAPWWLLAAGLAGLWAGSRLRAWKD